MSASDDIHPPTPRQRHAGAAGVDPLARQSCVVLLGDPRLPDGSKPGGRFTADDLDQVERLETALAGLDGYGFDFWNDHDRLLERLTREPPAFVLNFCDTGFRNRARHELHVAALLEMLDIPYSGSGPLALGLCFDKALVRVLAREAGIAVPRESLLPAGGALPRLDYPVFIKPNRADGSVGISRESIAANAEAAAACVARLADELPGAEVLVQQFLTGAEYSVGLIGNPDTGFHDLPLLEVDYSALPAGLPRLLDYGSKTDPNSPYWTDVRFRAARLPVRRKARLVESCARLFARLGLRDYARFDFRCDAGGRPRLLEVNPNPAWCWDGKLAHMAQLAGENHRDLLARIVDCARRRCFG